MTSTVAYLGPQGTFTEAAMVALTAGMDDVRPIPVSSPAEAVDAVRSTKATYAVVAIENSVDGPVTPTFDALADGGVRIVREVDIQIAFAIMVRPGTRQADVRTFSTHPVARPQVAGWLAQHMPQAEFLPASSNAAAAQAVAEGRADAAAAPVRAADIYGLEVMAEGIADVAGAHTRFVLVGAVQPPAPPTGNDRTSVVFTLPNTPGSLVGALNEFSSRGVDLTRIESRPTRQGLGTYRFYADLKGHVDDAPVAEALAALHRRSESVYFLGSWPAASGEATAVGPRWEESILWVKSLRS